jgi:hypothetical protein
LKRKLSPSQVFARIALVECLFGFPLGIYATLADGAESDNLLLMIAIGLVVAAGFTFVFGSFSDFLLDEKD